MTTTTRCTLIGLTSMLTILVSATARGEVIYETDPPGGPLCCYGYDVGIPQSVAIRFTPDADYTLDAVSVWFMSNDFQGTNEEIITLTVRTDDTRGGGSVPGDRVLDTMTFEVSAVGWTPTLEDVDSVEHPYLKAGVNYWLVAESDEPFGNNGVWVAAQDTGFVANTDADGEWYPGGMGGAVGTIVYGSPATVCAADLDADGAVNVSDLLQVLGAWGACAGCAEDLDDSGAVDVADLLELLAAWGSC